MDLIKKKLLKELQEMGIENQAVLDAIEQLPREEFVPIELRRYAYFNAPLAIGKEQTISQPYMVALMSQLLEIKPGNRVFEIGTGSGYQAAVLAMLGADVYTVERIFSLYEGAKEVLERLQIKVSCFYEDGFDLGRFEDSFFDRIIVTAALEDDVFLNSLEKKLNPRDGILVVPIGGEWEVQRLYKIVYHNLNREIISDVYCRFVPMKKGLRDS